MYTCPVLQVLAAILGRAVDIQERSALRATHMVPTRENVTKFFVFIDIPAFNV